MKYIIFSYRNVYKLKSIFINGCEIEVAKEIKFLGLTLDTNLTFVPHINNMLSLISRHIGILRKISPFVPEKVLLTLYNAFINSKMSYAIELWYNAANYIVQSVCILQKRAVRAIKNAHYLAHTDEFFNNLDILKLESLYELKISLVFYKSLNNCDYFPDLYEYIFSNTNAHSYFTRNSADIVLPLYKRAKSQNSIYFRGANIWNNLDVEVKNADTVHKFKFIGKNYLLEKQREVESMMFLAFLVN